MDTLKNYCLLFFLIIYVLTAGCKKEQTLTPVKKTLPDQQFTDSRIIITENSFTTAIVEAHHINVYEDQNYTVIEDSMTIDFFNKDGIQVSTLTALSGEVWGLYENVDSLKATGDVVIISEERNAKMETQEIYWIASTHKIYANSTVRLSTEDAVEEGIQFEATDDLKNYTMKNVQVEIQGAGIDIPER